MRVIFNEELKQVADDLDRMAQEVRTAILGAGKALLESDVEAAQNVIDGDLEIDALETSVINQCVQLLAKQGPVATDLRVVVSTLRLASTFERMGDLARHIAEIARRTYPESALTPETREIFAQMQSFLNTATQNLITALSTRDEKLAEQIIIDDDKLDELHHQIFDIVNGANWSGNTQQTIDVVLLGRFYERFGDHAVSTARRLVYIVSGFDPSKEPKSKADAAKDPYLNAE
ncbi:PhoU family transcriptional regulator [Bifidobacterium margollesii]|uniref:Phosphate-specific transport system accessory protein PhoU n=1 Tax=Bifidobacterium margollesii TaxID=2020964 RepID=A0A2N5J8V7_9BIFI|nr:phosphate signaling complex protein PhoU [Bifidobacterium margollesii]PLS30647.1 PhoU family transcriptional regulator [Bifidobacterium margollesii]